MKQQQQIRFRDHMIDALVKMNAYQNLITQVERTRMQTFSSENAEHERMLYGVWTGLKGEQDRLTDRITKRWTEIGFQGSNPPTDFRGMGMLALEGLQ